MFRKWNFALLTSLVNNTFHLKVCFIKDALLYSYLYSVFFLYNEEIFLESPGKSIGTQRENC